MKKHTYYRLILKLASPLAVGSGENALSDHDCVRHKNGQPYIPAASMAGVFRHGFDGEKSADNSIFGSIEGSAQQSSVIFYDAEPLGNCAFTIRDSVKLKDKIGVYGAKFDMEVVETGAEFITYIEIDKDNSDKQKCVEQLFTALRNGILRFGTKTSRGYGMVEIVSLKKLEFDLESDKDTDNWLEFDMFEQSAWNNADEFVLNEQGKGSHRIRLTLKQRGPVSIRVYTTDAKKNGEGYAPDYKHITLRSGEPVIPGTSWAGAFRERYGFFAGEEAVIKLFGDVYLNEKNETVTQRSRIVFSESVIKNSITKNITRNSIDRFSAKTKDSALYTEKTIYNGITELLIILPDDVTDQEKKCLSAVIFDLNKGFLSVGGLATVGHGMFTVEGISVNGNDKTACLSENDLMEMWR